MEKYTKKMVTIARAKGEEREEKKKSDEMFMSDEKNY